MQSKEVYLDETPLSGTSVHTTELHNELISILAQALAIEERHSESVWRYESDGRRDRQRDGLISGRNNSEKSKRGKEGREQ